MNLTDPTPSRAPSREIEQLLDDLAQSLEIPAHRYESAERSYQSVGRWLDRPGSLFANVGVTVYAQGSFRLGTVVHPLHAEEDYDLDVVCEVDLNKSMLSQAELKRRLGVEVTAYAKAHGMSKPVEARRCWTLNYADEAQFHMDILPSLPDGARQRYLVEAAGLNANGMEQALAITCIHDLAYRVISADWPGSNPKGYADWFRARMKVVFDARRQAIALREARASVEDIPEYRVKTPLQSAIQILKRHRDVRFEEEPEIRPISIIITTLAAHAYGQETTIAGALYGILNRMHLHVHDREGVSWIANPADPRENFADKWEEVEEKKTAFFDWLQMAREDFELAAGSASAEQFIEALAPRMGRSLVEAVVQRHHGHQGRRLVASASLVASKLRRLIDAPHRKVMTWPALTRGSLQLREVIVEQRGFRPYARASDGDPIPKHCALTFDAQTDIAMPYKVFWQVVNTGNDARNAKGLRGGFDEGVVQSGRLTRSESTLYAGSHSIECLIVKDGYCVARSGPFVINIA